MRLDKIHIDGFGKLKNFDLDLTDGLNLLYGENEAGKSTVMAFIKMMFYGSSKTTANILKSPRKRYLPFSGDEFGGKIEFTCSGTRYRLERKFKSSNTTDKVTLWNLTTGEKQNVPSSGEVGTLFFGLTAAAFEQSVFISAADVGPADSVAAGEIGSKLANLVSSGSEEVSFETVSSRLASARFNYKSKSGHIGISDKLNAKLSALTEELKTARERDEAKFNLGVNAEGLKKITADLERQLNEARKAVETYEKAERAKALRKIIAGYEQLHSEEKKLEELEKSLTFGDKKADSAFFDRAAEIITSLKSVNDKLGTADSDDHAEEKVRLEEIEAQTEKDSARFKTLTDEKTGHEAEREELLKQVANAKPQPAVALIIIGALLLGLGAAGFFVWPYLAALAAVGALMLALGFVVKKPSKKTLEAQKSAENLAGVISSLESEIAAISDKLAANDTLKESITAILEAESEKIRLENEKADFEKALAEHFDGFCEGDTDRILASARTLRETFNAAEKGKVSVAALRDIVTKNGDLAAAKAELEALGELPDTLDPKTMAVTENRLAIDRLSVKISDYKTRISATDTEIRTAFVGKRSAAQVENEIARIKTTLAEQEEYCAALEEAYAVLRESYEEMMNSFGPALNSRTAEIFENLTDGNYTKALVSKDLSIAAESKASGDITDWQYLSAGTADQAYLSLKLAVAELIGTDKNRLPVMLDDPFIQYDDTRTANGIKFLNEYSKERQVIMFTCRGEIKKAAEKLAANIMIF